ncbi:hypothetical protein HELRODRAFT_169401 [Helobdella robusta]|uniref:HTH psq-type domain-containing protein n=1 Tax=Helobdella robusta TaxID=6412 RepID=T1F1W4_HELRO|nr:hypothetical protein HELRODRAFT_169401 [Helobdella robusta]ESO08536.1 hypothetical protein HELRODRAFT_169401 [Helobdella robusta]
MPRSCKRKSARGSYGEESLRQALAAIHDGTPVKTAARQYGIPQRILRRHWDKKVLYPGKLKLGRFESDIPIQYEKELTSKMRSLNNLLQAMLSEIPAHYLSIIYLRDNEHEKPSTTLHPIQI